MSELSAFLPTVLDRNPLYEEPSIDVLSRKARSALARLEAKRRHLQATGQVATGDEIVIIAAGQNGYGRASEAESQEHAAAALRIARFLSTIGLTNASVIEGATIGDLQEAMRDRSVSDVMFVGHGERSNLILDRTATWKMLGIDMDHLKHSVGIIGCSTSFKDTVSPRLGTVLIPDDGLLYGKQEGAAHPSEMADIGNFYALSRVMTGFDALDIPVYRPEPAHAPHKAA